MGSDHECGNFQRFRVLMIHSRSDFDIMYDDRRIALRSSQSVFRRHTDWRS